MVPVSMKRLVVKSKIYNKLKAATLAKSSKRLDLCAAELARIFHLAGLPSVKSKVCLEVGSGWVLSHALVLHLLGASRVITSDIQPLAQVTSLSYAIRQAVPAIVRDILSPFGEHNEIRYRLNNLLSINKFSYDVLNGLGIEYIAPIDLARNRLHIPLDFIYSLSVLEYVTAGDIPALLENLGKDLQAGGVMIHCIHLEDDNDILNSPFDFYSESELSYARRTVSRPLNRIRCSQWREIFNHIEELDSRFIYQWSRCDRDLPTFIDPSISHTSEDDLRVSHIGVLSIKK